MYEECILEIHTLSSSGHSRGNFHCLAEDTVSTILAAHGPVNGSESLLIYFNYSVVRNLSICLDLKILNWFLNF